MKTLITSRVGVVRQERRQYPRYAVTGSFLFEACEPCERQYIGIPLNVSLGGILMQIDLEPTQGAWGLLHLRLNGLDAPIEAEIRVVRASGITAAAIFFFAPPVIVSYLESVAVSFRGPRPAGH